MLYLWIKNWCN